MNEILPESSESRKREGSKTDRKPLWQKMDITPELVIVGLVLIAILSGEKEIFIAVVAGLTGYLSKKVSG